MVRTYPTYPAECRLARNLVGLPRFDAFSLMRLARENSGLGEVKHLTGTLTYRVAERADALLNRIPFLRPPLKMTMIFLWKCFKKLRQAIVC